MTFHIFRRRAVQEQAALKTTPEQDPAGQRPVVLPPGSQQLPEERLNLASQPEAAQEQSQAEDKTGGDQSWKMSIKEMAEWMAKTSRKRAELERERLKKTKIRRGQKRKGK